ncbi:hypothetical protein GCM10020295_62010 [Streptomyces cinereospinus]
MSEWNSMCSGLRLVNTATSKTQPSTRPRTSAWLETSMATASTPRSRITANSAWRSVASGVVRSDLIRSSPIRVSTVPISPAGRPCPQTALDEIGGGGLAGGAGDADLEQLAAGVAVDRRRQFAHPRARVVDGEHRQAGGRGAFGAGRVGQHGGGAEADGLGDEVGTVRAGAGQGGVQVARADGARVVGDARDPGGPLRRGDTQLAGEVREGCGGDPFRPGRSRVGHGSVLLGGWGLISVWHGGERTGRTRSGAKRGAGVPWFPGSGVIVVTDGSWMLGAAQGVKVTG